MALTFFQKLQVAFRGWSRRREEEEKKRNEEFLARNASWGPSPPSASAHLRTKAPVAEVDLDGLQVAYLDDSGRIEYYLDLQTGEVMEMRDTPPPSDRDRFRRVPQRGADSEERRAFVETLEESRVKEFLKANVDTADWRKILATDRNVERAWYNFRNARATSAIASWLRSLGVR
jgi:hypothetical protein